MLLDEAHKLEVACAILISPSYRGVARDVHSGGSSVVHTAAERALEVAFRLLLVGDTEGSIAVQGIHAKLMRSTAGLSGTMHGRLFVEPARHLRVDSNPSTLLDICSGLMRALETAAGESGIGEALQSIAAQLLRADAWTASHVPLPT